VFRQPVNFFSFFSAIALFFLSSSAFSALIQNDTRTPAADTKLDHRFGAGLMVGGGSGVMGLSADVNFNPFLSVTGYFGTGYEYTSLGVKTQYYILGKTFHPFIGMGYAYWFAKPGIQNPEKINPGLIFSSLLNETERKNIFTDGFDLHLFYPTFGIQFIHESQFSVTAELMYLFDISDFSGSPYFGFSSHFYF